MARRKVGLSRRSFFIALEIARGLVDATKARVRETPLEDNQSELQKLAKLAPADNDLAKLRAEIAHYQRASEKSLGEMRSMEAVPAPPSSLLEGKGAESLLERGLAGHVRGPLSAIFTRH